MKSRWPVSCWNTVDDLEHYETITYTESMTAWRLLSGQWLSTHWLMPFGDEEEGRTRVRLTQRMP